ncbi:MAG: ABC transporter ATP-binding protein [Bacteroidota bacterium]
MSEESILKLQNLSKRYGNLRALNNLNLNVTRGNVYGLLGPNGSGKTTTLSIALGILNQSAGECFWFGEKPTSKSRLRIGSLIESPNFYPYLTLNDNLRIAASIKNVPFEDINRVLGLTNLLKRKYSRFRHLSSGLKQRLALASVLLGNPEVLVLDEPTKSLDPEGFSDLREIINKQHQEGKTIILASHILDEVEKVCTHVGILKAGELLREGRVDQILKKVNLIYVDTPTPDDLIRALSKSDIVQEYKQDKDGFQIILKDNYTASDLNKYLFDNNIVLNRLESKKNTLENEFLELIK